MSRVVTEMDFRAPEFRHAKVEDYEFRENGDLVRKDRWETTVRRIACQVVGSRSKFECDEIVDAVCKLVARDEGWIKLPKDDPDDYPTPGAMVDIRVEDGSVLREAVYTRIGVASQWIWNEMTFDPVAWRDPA